MSHSHRHSHHHPHAGRTSPPVTEPSVPLRAQPSAHDAHDETHHALILPSGRPAALVQDPHFAEYPEDEPQDQHARARAATRSTWVSVMVNVVLTLLQLLAGWLTHSQGLIADGIHSLSDLVSDAVVLVAGHESRKDADTDHPYGHHRFENAASLALGLLLGLTGAGMLWSAVQKIQSPETSTAVHMAALWVALAALIAKELLFRYMLAVAQRVKSSMLMANAWHARSDAASSLVVALGIGGSLLGFPFLDPVAALIVGLMILRMGWRFSRDALDDLVDRAADEEEVQAIRQTLQSTPGVMGAHDLRTRKMGDLLLVDVHLEVNSRLTVEEGHNIAVEARRRVLSQHRVLNLMTHVDPQGRPDLDHNPANV